MSNSSELRTWLYALLTMAVISAVVFATQRFIIQAFNTTFEILVFYIPTVILAFIYIGLRRHQKKKGDTEPSTSMHE